MPTIRFLAPVLLLAAGIGLSGSPCMAQTRDTILFCGATLHIGMTKTDVLDAVGKQCAVKETNVLSRWCVSGSFACLGFDRNNKLNYVTKDLGSAESAATADLLATFISAVDDLTGRAPGIPGIENSHSSAAIIETSTSMAREPDTNRDIVLKHVSVTVGHKTIELQVNRPVGGDTHPTGFAGIAVIETLSD
jgi:hypothetical protein